LRLEVAAESKFNRPDMTKLDPAKRQARLDCMRLEPQRKAAGDIEFM